MTFLSPDRVLHACHSVVGSRALLGTTLLLTIALGGCRDQGPQPLPEPHTGPPFAEIFPDATVLVTATDIPETRRKLAYATLPATREHHDELLSLLRSLESITIEHLLLLTEAVYLEGESFRLDGDEVTVAINGQSDQFAFAARKDGAGGEFADVVDQILLEGIGKVQQISRFDCGRIFGRTQSNDTLASLADILLPAVDDGSADALREILRGLGSSLARVPFIVEVMAPRGGLTGEREEVALMAINFDSDRVALIRKLIEQVDEILVDHLNFYLDEMSFDEGRVSVFESAVARLPVLDGADLEGFLRRVAFDGGRVEVAAAAAAASRLDVDFEDVPRILRAFSFDSSRVKAVESIAPFVSGEPDAVQAGAAVRAFSYDDGRVAAIEALAPVLAKLSEDDRKRLLRNIDDDGLRAAAGKKIGIE